MILTSTSKTLIHINSLFVDLLLALSFMLLFAFLVFIVNHHPLNKMQLSMKCFEFLSSQEFWREVSLRPRRRMFRSKFECWSWHLDSLRKRRALNYELSYFVQVSALFYDMWVYDLRAKITRAIIDHEISLLLANIFRSRNYFGQIIFIYIILCIITPYKFKFVLPSLVSN